MAPADNADTPDFISVPANVCAPIVAPAVVEAVAPAIRIPAIGASKNAGIFAIFKICTTSYCNAEALMIPAIVPVPINSTDTPTTLPSPNSVPDHFP